MALANRHPRLASPIGTLAAHQGVPDWTEVDRLIAEWQPGELVVGVPYNHSQARLGGGSNPGTSDSEAAALGFAAALAGRYPLAVSRVDERLSSAEAEDRLREQRRSGARTRRVRSGDVDAVAACVIAETWLDQ